MSVIPNHYPKSVHHDEWMALEAIAKAKGVKRNGLIRSLLKAAILEDSDEIISV